MARVSVGCSAVGATSAVLGVAAYRLPVGVANYGMGAALTLAAIAGLAALGTLVYSRFVE